MLVHWGLGNARLGSLGHLVKPQRLHGRMDPRRRGSGSEEDARAEDGEWRTGDWSGELIDVSECRVARKEGTESMSVIVRSMDSTAEDC